MVGTYRMTFDAKHPESNNCGSTNPDNGASGAECSAFIKVLNSSDFSELLFVETDTSELTTEWQTLTLDFEITEAMVGHIYQSGFMNTAGNYAPTGVHYDNVKVETYSETVEVTVTNQGNTYYMNGEMHGSITVRRGQTVVFDTSAFGNSHPFRLSKTKDGTFGGGTAYTEGVSGDQNTLTWVVPTDLDVDTMYYFCTLHAGMAGDGVINIID